MSNTLETEKSLTEQNKMSEFAKAIYEQKYAFKDEDGNVVEDWNGTAYRVVSNVLGSLGYTDDDLEFNNLLKLVEERKFLPGGRYLYASGRELHQTQNCLLLRAEDSREGWADLLHKSAMALMTGAGIGIDYSDVRASGTPIFKTGGLASGPISLMQMINESGRHIMQGGSRRSAIWAGLNWKHNDIFKFIEAKDWSDEVRALKEKDFNFPASLDMTNISVLLDDEFFDAYGDENHAFHSHAQEVYWETTRRMLKTAEPGFSVDTEINSGETLRNAPVVGSTHVLTDKGYKKVSEILDMPSTVWTGMRWAENVVFTKTMENSPTVEVKMTGGRTIRCEPTHEFLIEDWKGAGKRKRLEGVKRIAAGDLKPSDRLHVSLPLSDSHIELDNEAYTLGFIYGDGSFTKSGGADLTLCADESKACLPVLVGANSVNENDNRGYTRLYFSVNNKWSNRSKDTFPSEVLSGTADEIRSFLAGLFDSDGNWESSQKRIRLSSKYEDFLRGVGRALEQVGIMAHVSKCGFSTYGKSQSYQLVVASDYVYDFAEEIPTQRLNIELGDYKSYRASAIKVLEVLPSYNEDVYCADVKVPEHSFMAEGVIISNCTEVTSKDDSDICNLGSLNMAKFDSKEDFADAVYYGTLFLLAGTVYSHVPYEGVNETRSKNRRLGLGVMGIHEWLLKRGLPYEGNDELAEWLEEYAKSTEYAHKWADKHGLSRPIKTRAIAPTGTIGIIAETTTGIEPIFCVAYKRRYLVEGTNWKYQYVIDPTAKRLVEDHGVDPNAIEDAYTLSYDVEKRVAFQAFVQKYVDHGISSTINLPHVITDEDEVKDFGDMLLGYLPQIRGVTCYPDGCRAGQPLTSVPYLVANGKEGVIYEETEERCVGGSCGI